MKEIVINGTTYVKRSELIDAIVNTEYSNGMTLKEIYEVESDNSYDEGWNRCYEDFMAVLDRLREQNEQQDNF